MAKRARIAKDKRCGAKRHRKEGRTCGLPAGWGTDHVGYGRCKLHAGCTPGGKKAAEKQRAADEVLRLGLPRDISPHDALLEAVHRAAGWVAYLSDRISEVDDDGELVWGMVREEVRTGGEGSGTTTVHAARPNVWYEMLRKATRDMAEYASVAARAGVEDRQIRLAEGQAQVIADFARGVVAALAAMFEFDPNDTRVVKVVRSQLLEAAEREVA